MTDIPHTNLPGTVDQETNRPSGVNKHLYSTDPDILVGDNIYSNDKSSINKEDSYQTLDNRTIPIDTGEKINPFNVKGVPGCRECGGSGWKNTKIHPHPCNECAKRTVPVIDTYLTKVGQQTNVPEQERIIESTNQAVVTEIPETKVIRHIEEVPVITQVPVISYEEVEKKIPVEKVEYVTQNIPVTEIKSNIPLETGTSNQPYDFNTLPEMGDVNREVERVKVLTKNSHTHDTNFKGQTFHTYRDFSGIPGCKECGGDGWRRSKLTGGKKPCKECVAKTGNCPLCLNTGKRIDKDKKCKCMYAN